MMVDHVTLAAPNLADLQLAFTKLGMPTEYGGAHSNGRTHMAFLGFVDGSYIEIMSPLRSGDLCPLWTTYTLGPGGGTAWTVAVPNVGAELRRVRELGIVASEAQQISRMKPDGAIGRWDLAYLGKGQPGGTLPFLIADHTSREVRVRPSPSVRSRVAGVVHLFEMLDGVGLLILAVHDLEANIDLFRRVYSWEMPELSVCLLHDRFACFRGTPIALAASTCATSWISSHLRSFGESPCAILIGCRDIETIADRLGLQQKEDFFGRPIVWVGANWPGPARLGFIAAST